MANSEFKRAGSAATHYFENSDTLVYNLKLYSTELDNAPEDNGYKNFGVITEADKMAIYPISNLKEDAFKRNANPVLSFSIPVDKISTLIDSNGYIDLVAAPSLNEEKDKQTEKNPNLNTFVVYQRQALPDEPDKKINNFCGRAYNFKELFLGNAFENVTKDNFRFLNISINKTRLLSCTPPNSSVYVSLTQSPKSESFLVNLSPEKPTESKAYVFKLDMDKINLCPSDVNGSINLTSAPRKEKAISKDNADMNIWDNSQYYISKDNPLAETEKTDAKFFVGKGFSAEAQKKWFVVKDTANDKAVDTPLEKKAIEKDSVVSFPLENDFFLNKNFGVGNYQAFGRVTEITPANVSVDSVAGSFSFAKEKVLPATSRDLDTFSIFYDNLKEIAKQKQKQAVLKNQPAKKRVSKSQKKTPDANVKKTDASKQTKSSKNKDSGISM